MKNGKYPGKWAKKSAALPRKWQSGGKPSNCSYYIKVSRGKQDGAKGKNTLDCEKIIKSEENYGKSALVVKTARRYTEKSSKKRSTQKSARNGGFL